MTKNVALYGSPLEDIPILKYDKYPNRFKGEIKRCYFYGITDSIRKAIKFYFAGGIIKIKDFGEIDVGPEYSCFLIPDRTRGVYSNNESKFPVSDIKRIQASRREILARSTKFDLTVVIGPSHLGAITLYQNCDITARCDYHSDFFKYLYHQYYNHANYMNWVRVNTPNCRITNLFVKDETTQVHGKLADIESITDTNFSFFDIDIDCFDPKYKMIDANIYPFHNGTPDAEPEEVLNLIKNNKPRKLGFFEYRSEYDTRDNGLEFIIDAIISAVRE